MAAVTAPPGGSLIGKLGAAWSARRHAAGKRPAVPAFLVKAREHVVTVAALGAFDMGAFQVHVPHLGSFPGWCAVAVSLLLLSYAVEG